MVRVSSLFFFSSEIYFNPKKTFQRNILIWKRTLLFSQIKVWLGTPTILRAEKQQHKTIFWWKNNLIFSALIPFMYSDQTLLFFYLRLKPTFWLGAGYTFWNLFWQQLFKLSCLKKCLIDVPMLFCINKRDTKNTSYDVVKPLLLLLSKLLAKQQQQQRRPWQQNNNKFEKFFILLPKIKIRNFLAPSEQQLRHQNDGQNKNTCVIYIMRILCTTFGCCCCCC